MATGQTHDEHIAKLTGLSDPGKMEALQKAVYLAVDATDSAKDSGKIQDAISFLQQNCGLNRNVTLDKIVTPNAEHQWYTHLGWEYDYTKEPLPEGWTKEMVQTQQKIYTLRKDILLNTIKNIFPNMTSEKVNSMAALLYYTHMAGDLRWNNTPDYLVTISELSKNLQNHLKTLFGNKAAEISNRINEDLKNVNFENDAEPLDKVFNNLFNNVPELIKQEQETNDIQYSAKEESPQKQQNINQTGRSGGINFNGDMVKPILIVAGIIVIILVVLLLLRNCGLSTVEKQEQPNSVVIIDPPPPVVPDPPAPVRVIFTEKTEMLFVANSPNLLPASSMWLDVVANELSKYIEQNPGAIFQVIGYVAIVPGPPDSTELSMARATNIIKELSVRGIKSDNLRPVAGGETDRWGNNIDEPNRAPNRRILIQEEK
jgi:outer membrane protein OmpA-like peptidoglycan-associated protein